MSTSISKFMKRAQDKYIQSNNKPPGMMELDNLLAEMATEGHPEWSRRVRDWVLHRIHTIGGSSFMVFGETDREMQRIKEEIVGEGTPVPAFAIEIVSRDIAKEVETFLLHNHWGPFGQKPTGVVAFIDLGDLV